MPDIWAGFDIFLQKPETLPQVEIGQQCVVETHHTARLSRFGTANMTGLFAEKVYL